MEIHHIPFKINKKTMNTNNEYHVIANTHSRNWNEFDSEEIELAHNQEKGEQKKSFDIAYSVKNKLNDQRIVVLGDASFLSDAAINNYANRQFSLNVISWLSSKNIDEYETQEQDNYIQANRTIHFLLQWFFSIIFPFIVFSYMFERRLNLRKRATVNPEDLSE